MTYAKDVIESSAMKLLESDWGDHKAAELFYDQTLRMFRSHARLHGIPLSGNDMV
jgi:hypothetical protein